MDTKCSICGAVGYTSAMCDTCKRVGCSSCVTPAYTDEEMNALSPNSDAVISGRWLEKDCIICNNINYNNFYHVFLEGVSSPSLNTK